jgi:aminomethyltransferase
MDFRQIEQEYRAAQTGAILVAQDHHGRVRATGRDRLDLLHRMSTNDLTGLPPGQAQPTVLTTAIARIVDLVWVLPFPDEALLLTSPGQAESVRRWLSRYIFFQDDVVLQDRSAELGQFGLFGQKASRAAEALIAGAGELPPGRFLSEGGLSVLRARPVAGDGYTVIAPPGELAAAREKALAAGAVPGSEETYQVLRIEAGQPYGGHELTGDYIPLEANLWNAVSFTKGCYIGQEIIARMESRGRLAKTLVGLKLASPVQAGSEVRREGVAVGAVSSATLSPQAGPIALAFVKPASGEPGTQVEVDGVAGEIAALPIS